MAFKITYDGDDGGEIMLAALRRSMGCVVEVTYETGAPAWHFEKGDYVPASEYPGEVFAFYPWDDAAGEADQSADPLMLKPDRISALHIH